MRKRIYEIIEKSDDNDKASVVYDIFMLVVIVASLVPLFFKKENLIFFIIDKVSVVIFIIDYLLRWITADFKYENKKATSFIKYPFSFMAIIDLLSILPSLTIINKGFKALRVLRMIRAFRVIRVFKVARYSNTFKTLGRVLKKSKEPLTAV